MDSLIDRYTFSEELNIFIGSWNVGASQTKEEISLYEWLNPKKINKSPDIYCIGLQEIVELNPSNVLLISNASRVEYWKNNIKNNLDVIDK
jgi:inositol-1,4,5-trisphosphate 5-phosphatase